MKDTSLIAKGDILRDCDPRMPGRTVEVVVVADSWVRAMDSFGIVRTYDVKRIHQTPSRRNGMRLIKAQP